MLESRSRKILETVNRQEVLTIYNRESLKINLTDDISKELKTIRESSSSSVSAGYSITEVNVPIDFIGNSLAELKIRSKFGLEVLMIKHAKEIFSADVEKDLIITTYPNYRLKREDKLVLFGSDENIVKFKKF